ncbi:unnamed protein product [Rhizopus stolonifer]
MMENTMTLWKCRELRNHEDRSANTTLKNLRMNTSVYASMIDILTKAEPDTKKISNEEFIYEYSVVEDQSPILVNIEGHSSTSLLTALTLLNDMRHLKSQLRSKCIFPC